MRILAQFLWVTMVILQGIGANENRQQTNSLTGLKSGLAPVVRAAYGCRLLVSTRVSVFPCGVAIPAYPSGLLASDGGSVASRY
jgi:hypothetical protein